MAISDYLKNNLLDHFLGDNAYAVPANVEVALFTVAPTDAGGGTEVSTAVWTNYVRLTVANTSDSWNNAEAGEKNNSILFDFGAASIIGTAPTIVAAALYDTYNNLLFWGTFQTPLQVANGKYVRFMPGDFIVQIVR